MSDLRGEHEILFVFGKTEDFRVVVFSLPQFIACEKDQLGEVANILVESCGFERGFGSAQLHGHMCSCAPHSIASSSAQSVLV